MEQELGEGQRFPGNDAAPSDNGLVGKELARQGSVYVRGLGSSTSSFHLEIGAPRIEGAQMLVVGSEVDAKGGKGWPFDPHERISVTPSLLCGSVGTFPMVLKQDFRLAFSVVYNHTMLC